MKQRRYPKSRRPNATGRSERTDQYGNWPYAMFQSAAWRSLSGPAVKVYFELRCRFYGGNNGRLALSMDEGARLLGHSKSTIQRALQELEEKGFIVCTNSGRWYGRLAATYAVTDKGVDGDPPTNAWKQWQRSGGASVLPRNQKTEIGTPAEPSR